MIRSRIEPPCVGEIFRPTGGKNSATEPRVLLLLHEECPQCEAWTRRELGEVEGEIRRWGGAIERLRSEFGTHDPTSAWLAVLDEWDEVFHVADIGPSHTFPDPVDLVEWVRFVAIQCPECHTPERRWRC